MITRRTKMQLLVFVIITLLGVSYVGARYAKLDKAVRDDSFEVTAHFAEAGGIFAGAEVTYRGVGIGTVDRLELTEEGVDVVLKVDNQWDEIPSETIALVGNRSAVGEQFVELQPKVDPDQGEHLSDGSEIAMDDTRTPIQTEELLTNLSTTVNSVDQEALKTTVDELGAAFDGTGDDLQQIIDTGNSFIEEADRNFEITTQLIEDSNVVLQGQIDSGDNLEVFAEQLALFSGTIASDQTDGDLRRVIDNGSMAANQLRTFIEENQVELASLIRNLTTTGEVFVKHLDGLKQVLVIYPYIVEGGFTVASREGNNPADAHFGLIISSTAPCTEGYDLGERRSPNDRFGNPPMDLDARCTEPPTQSNARGAQNLDRVGTGYAADDVDVYVDTETGEVTWPSETTTQAPWVSGGTVAPASLGKESWKWLYLEPLTGP